MSAGDWSLGVCRVRTWRSVPSSSVSLCCPGGFSGQHVSVLPLVAESITAFSGTRPGPASSDIEQSTVGQEVASQVEGFAASSSSHNESVPVVLEAKGLTVVQATTEGSEFNVSTDGTSPVRVDGSDVGGQSDGLNVWVEQRHSFLPDPVIPHAPLVPHPHRHWTMTLILQLIPRYDTVRHRPLLQLCAPLSVMQSPFTPRNLEQCTSHFPLSTLPQLLRPLRGAARVEMVQSPSVPDGWTDGAVLRDGLRQLREIQSVLRDGQMDGSGNSRDGFSTSGQDFSSEAVQKELMDATEEVKNTPKIVEKVVVDASSASRDGLRMPQCVPSDAQHLHARG